MVERNVTKIKSKNKIQIIREQTYLRITISPKKNIRRESLSVETENLGCREKKRDDPRCQYCARLL